MSRFLVSALSVAVLLGLGALAFAGQPDINQCDPVTSPAYVGCSPRNLTVPAAQTYEFRYNLRDNTGAPVVGFPASQVELDFDDCFNTSTRPGDEIPADGPSDGAGDIVWSVNLTFGGSDPCAVDVLVQNQVYDTLIAADPGGVRSCDIDGNGNVALADLSSWQISFVTGGPPYIGDVAMPYNDTVGLADLSWWQIHFVQ